MTITLFDLGFITIKVIKIRWVILVLVPQKVRKFHYLTYPKIATVITSGTFENPNAMAASWTTPVSFSPPLFVVAISPKRYTYKLVKEHGDFGVNILPMGEAKIVYQVGYYSGAEFNKFEKFNIPKVKSKKIKAPLIGNSIAAFECIVKDVYKTGDHDLFVGEIVETWINPDLFDEQGRIKISEVSPVYQWSGMNFVGVDGRNVKSF